MRPIQISVRTAVLGIVLVLTAGFAWGQTTVQLDPSSPSISVGSSQAINVTVTGVTSLQASHVVFTFDNEKFTYVGVVNGGVFGSSLFNSLVTTSGSTTTVTVDQGATGAAFTGSGTLCTITLTAKDGAASTALGLTATLRDPLNVAIPAAVTGGSAAISNPAPTLSLISPTSATAGSTITTLTVTGTNFVPSSVIKLNGSALTTIYGSGTSLTASSVSVGTTAGTLPVTVTNPTPGGGTSTEVVNLTVNPAAASATTTTIAAAPTSIVANGTSTSILTVQLKDQYANNLSVGGSIVALLTDLGTLGTVNDNGNGTYTATLTSGTTAGTATVTGTLGGTTITDDATVTFTEWTATQLTFGVQPTSAVAGVAISPAVTVQIKDGSGNVVTTSSQEVTLALSSQTVYGTTTVAAINGVAAFNDLYVAKAGTGYTLTATGGTLTSAPSTAFDIAAAAVNAGNSSIAVSPSGTTADGSSTITITATARDFYGNFVPNQTVVLAATGSGNIVTQPASTTNASGVATGTLASTVAEVKTVSATAGGVLITGTQTVTFVAGGVSASMSTVVANPTSVTADGSTVSTITVTVTDASGNPLVGQSVSLAVSGSGNVITQPSNTNAGGVTTGTITSTVAEAKTITVTAGGVVLDTKPVVTFTAGAASKLTFGIQPANTVAGATMSAVTVRIEDAGSNLVTTATDNVTIALATNPSSGTLSGTKTVAAAGGVATFSTLSIDKAGTGYTLGATSGTLTAATSGTFDITVGEVDHFTIDPIPAQISGHVFSITITAKDVSENTVTDFAGTVTLTTSATSITPTTSGIFAAGVVHQVVTITGSGSAVTVTVTDASSHTGTSNTFAVMDQPHVYLKAGTSLSSASVLYPNDGWTGTTHEPNDWDFTSSPVLSFYVVPSVGMIFNSFSITLTWDDGEVSYSSAEAGSTGGSSFNAAPGTNSVTINNHAAGGIDYTTVEGDYLAKVNFTITKPGYADVRMSEAWLTCTTGGLSVTPHDGEVKAYLGDVASSGPTVTTGDGVINIVDLSPWSASYWSGVPGYTGITDYKIKYDIGPTADDYVFTLPMKDGKIDFEDLILFSIEYGLSGTPSLPKVTAPSDSPVEMSLGQPVVVGNETRIGVMVGGAVNDIRGVRLELSGEFGKFLGAEEGSLFQNYSTPILIMGRSQENQVFVDLAVAGLDAQGVGSAGELVVLRFEGTPRVRLTKMEARNSQNVAFATTRVQGAGESVPTEYRMSQNYPNPFNPTTVVSYQLPVASSVNLVVYDMMGREVATLVNEVKEAGYHQAQWDGRNLDGRTVSSGVYFYRIQSGKFNTVMRMLLLK